MARFIEVTDFDAFFKNMRVEERAALERLTDAQRELLADVNTERYFAYVVPEYDMLMIFGQVYSAAEARALEVKAGASEDEADYTAQGLMDARQRGYLYGRCFSIVEPTGEIGDTHVSHVVPIDKATFDLAKKLGWRPDPTPDGKNLAISLVECSDANGCPPNCGHDHD